MRTFSEERLGLDCGVDEVGRGSWAGPVVAAAVILPFGFESSQIDDSKKISKELRKKLFDQIILSADFGVGYGSVREINLYNILQATFLAMRRAVANLKCLPKRVLVDGSNIPSGLPCIANSVVKGDTKVLSIAAASIIAKITRDQFMRDLSVIYPGYGWERNVGYGVKEHRDALNFCTD